MAGYGRFPRNNSPFDGYDEWTYEPIHNPEFMWRSSDVEGRRRPAMVAYRPECNQQTYVIEEIVEQIHPSTMVIPEYYKQNTPSMFPHQRNYGEVIDNNTMKPLGRTVYGPPEVKEFFHDSRTALSQPPRSSVPREPHPLRIPISAGYPGPTSNTEVSNWGKPERTTTWSSTTTVPPPSYVRPEKVDKPVEPPRLAVPGRRWEMSGHDTGLSKPMTDIDELTKYLLEVAKPASDGDKVPKPPVTSETSSLGKPDHPTTWSSTPTVPPSYINVQSEKLEKAVEPQRMAMPLPGRRWEASGHNMGLPTPISTSETIDSNEARRRYEKLKPVPHSSFSTGGGKVPTIDHRKAKEKYNGAFV